ncbi:reverse transcriptase domain-containing protein [Tanacetum coccineum]
MDSRECSGAMDWKNCPKSLHGQFKRRDHKYPTLMLEAAADKRLWIWHAYFRGPGANNNLNVLYGSPLFDDEIADIAPESFPSLSSSSLDFSTMGVSTGSQDSKPYFFSDSRAYLDWFMKMPLGL